MNLIYKAPNSLWAIFSQDDLQGENCYSVYRSYSGEWNPFKLIGSSLKTAFYWLREKNIISQDEMTEEFKILGLDK